jgi:hypothetical protein
MRRVLPWALTAIVVVAAGGVVAIRHYFRGPGPPIVGTWSGDLMASPGNPAPPQPFFAVVDASQRTGSWRTGPHCAGTLRLKDISHGFRHYYRVMGANPGCAPAGIDCFKRDGPRMEDVFVSSSARANSVGEFRRVY